MPLRTPCLRCGSRWPFSARCGPRPPGSGGITRCSAPRIWRRSGEPFQRLSARRRHRCRHRPTQLPGLRTQPSERRTQSNNRSGVRRAGAAASSPFSSSDLSTLMPSLGRVSLVCCQTAAGWKILDRRDLRPVPQTAPRRSGSGSAGLPISIPSRIWCSGGWGLRWAWPGGSPRSWSWYTHCAGPAKRPGHPAACHLGHHLFRLDRRKFRHVDALFLPLYAAFAVLAAYGLVGAVNWANSRRFRPAGRAILVRSPSHAGRSGRRTRIYHPVGICLHEYL